MGPGSRAAPLSPDTVTLAAALRSRGYKTATTGKWHVGSADLALGPQRYGFEISHGSSAGRWTRSATAL